MYEMTVTDEAKVRKRIEQHPESGWDNQELAGEADLQAGRNERHTLH